MVTALIIGRFQPPHLGHFHVIKEAVKKYDEVIIGIGSSNQSQTLSNPFSFEEREEMLRLEGVKCKIIGIPDVEKDEDWCSQVQKMIDFDIVITGSEWVKRCFTREKEVVRPSFLLPEVYSGTEIRDKIIKGKEWEDLVPKKIADYIKRIDGEKRIRDLAEKELEF